MNTTDIQIITAVTALVAVTIGPLVTLYVAKMQSNVSVLAKSRQEWINALRDEVSQIIVVIRSLEMIMGLPTESRDPDKLLKNAELGKLKESKIRLLINPNETDHTDLINILHKALLEAMKDTKENKMSLDIIEDDIIKKAQEILKREWVRVKALQ